MAQPRTQHSATLLQSGKVLIAGGMGGTVSSGADLASSELYDPCTNTWSPAGILGQARNGHSAVLLRDGRVLVVGGSQNGWSVDTAELYDPLTNVWSPTGAPPGPGMALRLDNGQVLLVGDDVVDNTTALYDPTTDGWSPTGLDAHPRWGFGATLLGSGKVLLSGGFSIEPFSPAVLEAELYDPVSATWSPAGVLSRMRNGDAPVRLQSGRVLISGGYPQAPSPTPPASTEIYDPGANAWSAGENLLVARWIHTTTLLPSGDVLIAGGSSSSGAGSALASSELYDESSGNFRLTVSLHIARWSDSATLLPDGRVLIVGGNDGTNFLSSVEIYTPDTP
jgi:WD40 repeat protein